MEERAGLVALRREAQSVSTHLVGQDQTGRSRRLSRGLYDRHEVVVLDGTELA